MINDNLKIFTSVVRLGSFVATARTFNCDPSQISRAIAKLEQQLGARLFFRSTRKISLTADGEQFYARVQAILDDFEDACLAMIDTTSRLSGTVRLTAPTSMGQELLLPILQNFSDTYPDIRLDVILSNQYLDIIEEGIDVAIRTCPLVQQNFVCKKLWNTHYYFCASNDYLQSDTVAKSPLSHPTDIAHHAIISYPEPIYHKPWVFIDSSNQGQPIPVKTSAKLTISDSVSLKKFMLNGMGPAFMAHWIIQPAIDQGLCQRLFSDYKIITPESESKTWLVYANRKFLPKRVRVLIDFLNLNLKTYHIT